MLESMKPRISLKRITKTLIILSCASLILNTLRGSFLFRKMVPNMAALKLYFWTDCDLKYENRTESLRSQLIDIRDAFIASNVSHVITYGTLIGAMRDNGMNPYEVDNDIMLLQTTFPNKLYIELYQRGLILFEYDIWRICRKKNTDEQPEVIPIPWEGHYFPYTDVYNKSWFDSDESNMNITWDGKIIKRKWEDTFMYTTSDSYSINWLEYWYGKDRWKQPPHQKIKHGVDLSS